MSPSLGHVWLVGAGPGDPRLVTVAGLEALRLADVVVYDRLASPLLLDEAPGAALKIDAGKRVGRQNLTQDDITTLLLEHGRQGRRVVRLKGGDPFVFGRGGEEALALAAAGIPCTVIPGVTSAVSGPAAAGIPVTHRGLSGSLAIVSGHAEQGDPTEAEPWRRLAASADTLVVLMGARLLDVVSASIIVAGRDPLAPAAVVERATLTGQRTIRAPLAEIGSAAAEAGVASPAILVVGATVSLESCLAPRHLNGLSGRRVVVTRPAGRADALARLLLLEGAEPLNVPLLRVEPCGPGPAVQEALGRLRAGLYRWAAFASAAAVEEWFGRLLADGLDARAFGATRVCAIGRATADALLGRGIVADLVPSEATGTAAAAAIVEREELRGARVLVPCATEGDRGLPDGLALAGVIVDEVPTYRVVPLEANDAALDAIRAAPVDIVTLMSPSAARAWLVVARAAGLGKIPVACIGPTTAAAAVAGGLDVAIVAREHSANGLVEALRSHYNPIQGRVAQ